MRHHKLRFLGLAALFTCAAFVASAQKPQPAAHVFDSVVLPLIDSHKLAGSVVMVATKDSTLNLEAAGYADIAAKKAMRADAIF